MINYCYGVVPVKQNLLNAGSKSMAVNGSVTPVSFAYSPGGGNSVEIHKITCLLKQASGDNTSFTNFAAASALTNGISVQCTINSITSTIALIKDNSDICHMFPANQFGNGSVLSILSVVTPQGFGSTSNLFQGLMEFRESFILTGSDVLTVVIQDNLSSVGLLNMSISGIVLVPGA